MQYKLLDAPLRAASDAAIECLRALYGKGRLNIEIAIDQRVRWQPTFWIQLRTEIIACEVCSRPWRSVLETAFTDIYTLNLPVRVFSVFPTDDTLSLSEYAKDVEQLKYYGLGLIRVGQDAIAHIEFGGPPLGSFIQQIDLRQFPQSVRPKAKEVFEKYRNGETLPAIQEVGQCIEHGLLSLAKQATRRGLIPLNALDFNRFITQEKIARTLIKHGVIDSKLLGGCLQYGEKRNLASHKPKNIKEAKKRQKDQKTAFEQGLDILEDLPRAFRERNFRLHLSP